VWDLSLYNRKENYLDKIIEIARAMQRGDLSEVRAASDIAAELLAMCSENDYYGIAAICRVVAKMRKDEE
jgi:hypothetical protein